MRVANLATYAAGTPRRAASGLRKRFLSRPYSPEADQVGGGSIEVRHLSGRKATPLTDSGPSVSLPPLRPVIEAGRYEWKGQRFELADPGIYRFLSSPRESFQVFLPSGDLNEDLSSIGWLACPGDCDDMFQFDTQLQRSVWKRVELTCGSMSLFFMRLLRAIGHQVRAVMGLRLANWNSFDNGHTLLELGIGGEWRLFDPTLQAWITENGEYRNLVQVCSLLATNAESIQLMSLSSVEGGDTGSLVPAPRVIRRVPRMESSLFFESRFMFPGADPVAWLQTVLQAPGILEDDLSVSFGCESQWQVDRIRCYSKTYKTIAMEHFLTNFYSGPNC